MDHTMKCKISSSPIVNVIVTERGNDDYADTFSNGVMVWFRLKGHSSLAIIVCFIPEQDSVRLFYE